MRLSNLLDKSFLSLNSLIPSDCGLNSEDLCSLAQACVEGRLPQLKHLDTSGNPGIDLKDLFLHNGNGHQLEKLKVAGTCISENPSLRLPCLSQLTIFHDEYLRLPRC